MFKNNSDFYPTPKDVIRKMVSGILQRDIVKIQSGVCVDSVAHSQGEPCSRWLKLGEDISEIYMNGTTEERNAIDEAFRNVDKEVLKC